MLALGILTVIRLSRVEPMKTLLRVTEQHDLGKLAFAFVMLNIYLTFAEFSSSGRAMCRTRFPGTSIAFTAVGGYICTADFCCHWLIPSACCFRAI